MSELEKHPPRWWKQPQHADVFAARAVALDAAARQAAGAGIVLGEAVLMQAEKFEAWLLREVTG